MSAESDLAPVLHIERELRHLSVLITQPKPGECLNCYVYRMLEFGCTGPAVGQALSRESPCTCDLASDRLT
jgi:hypothetical protein